MRVELHVVLFSAIHRGENRSSSCLFSRRPTGWKQKKMQIQGSCVVQDGLNLCRFWVTIMEIFLSFRQGICSGFIASYRGINLVWSIWKRLTRHATFTHMHAGTNAPVLQFLAQGHFDMQEEPEIEPPTFPVILLSHSHPQALATTFPIIQLDLTLHKNLFAS